MFKLIRFVLLLLAAFAAGIIYERGQQRTLCADMNGSWQRPGVCQMDG